MQILHLTWKSHDLIDLNAHGSEYDNFNINEQMSSFIMHAIELELISFWVREKRERKSGMGGGWGGRSLFWADETKLRY